MGVRLEANPRRGRLTAQTTAPTFARRGLCLAGDRGSAVTFSAASPQSLLALEPLVRNRFSRLTGAIFKNTNKPLKDWFRIAQLMLVSKKGER
jgi:hypothetical protein